MQRTNSGRNIFACIHKLQIFTRLNSPQLNSSTSRNYTRLHYTPKRKFLREIKYNIFKELSQINRKQIICVMQ